MGNIITSGIEGNFELKASSSLLNQYIHNWAINEYSVHPEAKGNLYKNILKKRACCLRKVKSAIGLPGINTKGNIEQYKVNIRIFADEKDITDGGCSNLGVVTDSDSSYLGQINRTDLPAKETCQTFFPLFCNYVRENRSNYLNKYTDQLYGPNPDDDATGSTGNVNSFVDCNCENSMLKIYAAIYKPEAASIPKYVQTADPRCNSSKSDCYIKQEESYKDLCINIATVGDVSFVNAANANLKLNQTCNINTGTVGTAAPAVTTPVVTTPVVTTPAVTTPAVTTPALTTKPVTTAVTTPALTTKPVSTSTIPTAPAVTTKPAVPSSAVSTQTYLIIGGVACCCCIFLILLLILLLR